MAHRSTCVSNCCFEDSLNKNPGKQSIGISENRLFNKVDFCFLNNDIYFFQDLDNPACKKRKGIFYLLYIYLRYMMTKSHSVTKARSSALFGAVLQRIVCAVQHVCRGQTAKKVSANGRKKTWSHVSVRVMWPDLGLVFLGKFFSIQKMKSTDANYKEGPAYQLYVEGYNDFIYGGLFHPRYPCVSPCIGGP